MVATLKKKTLSKATKNFIAYAINDMLAHGVEVQLVQEPSIFCKDDGSFVNGYFEDADSKTGKATFAVALQKPLKQWFPIFVHEYAHFVQYREGISLWAESSEERITFKKEDGKKVATSREELFWDYVSKKVKTCPEEQIFDAMKAVQNLEFDCEKRVIKLIKKHKLHRVIPPTFYVKRANSYMWFYNYVLKYKKWYKIGKEPYNIRRIINSMPTDFDQDYDILPEKYERMVNKYCFGK